MSKTTKFTVLHLGRAKIALTAALFCATACMPSFASSIAIDSVAQRWPWNNKLDITYTITDGQDAANGLFCRVVFTASVDSVEYEIDGRKIGACASNGTHVATWTLPDGLKASGCTMTATLLSAEAPSGDDYMVIDLTTGDVTFEGLMGVGTAGQTASNTRYNSDDTYKTSKMVLRKVPRWADRATLPYASALPTAGYATGSSLSGYTYNTMPNSPTNWTTACDYYIGIFEMTGAQACKFDSRLSTDTYGSSIKPIPLRWNVLRTGEPSDEQTPNASGSTLQRLNKLTYDACGISGFDLPTEVMWEIAARSGREYADSGTDYYIYEGGYAHWGDYAVYGSTAQGMANVGTKAASYWGLFDMAGNAYEMCRDELVTNVDLVDRGVDAFTPYDVESDLIPMRGAYFGSSANITTGVNRNQTSKSISNSGFGFRVSYIVK